jgi:hypothetical protein
MRIEYGCHSVDDFAGFVKYGEKDGTKKANACYSKTDGWNSYGSGGAMQCDNQYDILSPDDFIYFNFSVPCSNAEYYWIGVEFKCETVGLNDGPDLEVPKNPNNYNNPDNSYWNKIKRSMGKHNDFRYYWYEIGNKYVNKNDNKIRFRILCALGAKTVINNVAVRWIAAWPDLDASGSLSWDDVEPGSTVTGSFKLKNIGDPCSELDWTITNIPDWGSWTFNPSSGNNLAPEDGEKAISVSCVAPMEGLETFTGEIQPRNNDGSNGIDFARIPVSLTTTSLPTLEAWVNSDLQWSGVELEGSRTGYVYVKNNGDTGSNLNWEVFESLSWVTCTPSSDTNLKPGNTDQIVVTVGASDSYKNTRSGSLIVKNSDNPSQSYSFDVKITTKGKGKDYCLFYNILERYPFFKNIIFKFFF